MERILLALKILRQADPTKPSIRFIGDTNSEKNLERIVLDKINQHFPEAPLFAPTQFIVWRFCSQHKAEYFRPQDPTNGGYYDDFIQSWLEASEQWLIELGDDRIVRAELHLDEMAPHIHAYGGTVG